MLVVLVIRREPALWRSPADVVRDRLERDIGAWAGHAVSLGDAPSLDFWPTPTITLDKVVIQPGDLFRRRSDPARGPDRGQFQPVLSGCSGRRASRSSG
jgi:hypothetical protein